ncbi:hypothetical protein QTP86_005305 [Hemibagrus guttatus]|nr:hypothetical protein QTP86_005305 [Hemibagrus guttatus]
MAEVLKQAGTWQVSSEGQGAISERLRSFSIPDLTQVPSGQSALGKPSKLSEDPSTQGSEHEQAGQREEVDGTFSEDDSSLTKGLRRTQSVKMSRAKVIRKEQSFFIVFPVKRTRFSLSSHHFEDVLCLRQQQRRGEEGNERRNERDEAYLRRATKPATVTKLFYPL